jgi:hypothetical protein
MQGREPCDAGALARPMQAFACLHPGESVMPQRIPQPPRPVPNPPRPAPDPAAPAARENAAEGMLDLDEHDQINNQHLEVR